MSPRTWRFVRMIAAATVMSAAFGAAFARRGDWTAATVALGIVAGALIGLVLSTLEILTRRNALLRRLPLIADIALRTLVYGAVVAAAIPAAAALVGAVAVLPADAGMLTRPTVIFSAGAALAINLVFLLRAMLGGGTLLALLAGRYRRPRAERRVVLFLDLRGSTAIAERLGDAAFLGLLDRVVQDIADPILAAGGEIYRYVGDEVIVTWRERPGRAAPDCIACVFAIRAALAARRGDYEAAYGVAPQLRAALHAGPVVVGEMGELRREIVILGDVMNTAARIEEACRATGHDVIASDAVLGGRPPPAGIAAIPLGPMPLRGKAEPLVLFALAEAAASRVP